MYSGKTDYIARCLSRGTNKKYETMIINAIYWKLNNFNLEIATQQYVLTDDGRKYIDLYFPQLKIAIEIDEIYHESCLQRELDKKRIDNINLSILESTILDSKDQIEFIRIKVTENGSTKLMENLNKEINSVVKKINDKIKSFGKLEWEFDEKKRLDKIKQNGLKIGDSFYLMKDILYIFGKNLKSCRKCYYKITKTEAIWSPTLSVNNSNKNGWVNTITDGLDEIYEYAVDNKHGKNKKDTEKDIQNNVIRYVFLKYKDVLGCKKRKYLGIYKADRFDEQKNAEVWKLVN